MGQNNFQHDVQVFDFLAALFSEKVRNMSPDEIRIPPEPPGRCSSQLQVNTPPQMCACLSLLMQSSAFSDN